MTRARFPFGPQHPVFPEALQLQLVTEDERVVEVVPVLGYMHRGIEKAAERRPYTDNVFLCERICGICSFMHGLAYCQAIEAAMKIKVPPRAEYLRVFWSELSRLHNHVMWAGLLADALGFESLFMECWRTREVILDILEMTTGQRVIQSACIIGGVRRNLDREMAGTVRKLLDDFWRRWKRIAPVFTRDYTVKSRTVEKGILPPAQARALGVVGPTARGSGVPYDARLTGYAAYKELGFTPVTEKGCDCYARMLVRIREVAQSFELVHRVLDRLPEGNVAVKVKGLPEGEGMTRVEQHRGEVFYFVRGNGTPYLERLKVRTPTYANIPALFVMLPGSELPDVGPITLSIDPCIACTER
ncbi:MAG: nickel-dependent hydrogenase large subunit [Bacillota bacterium]